MGRRIQLRQNVQLPVRIFGTDHSGSVFSDKVVTVNVSRSGVELASVQPKLAVDEIIGLTYGAHRVHFRVKWIGQPGTAKAGHVGLLNISPEKSLWDLALPLCSPDIYEPGAVERRKQARFRCHNPIEIHVRNGASLWGTIADLSLGGCYVEMPIPLEPGTRLKVGIWIGPGKVWAEGEVAHRTRGLGLGIQFTEVASQDLEQIQIFLGSLTPFARKRGVGQR
jgi:PilZ domain